MYAQVSGNERVVPAQVAFQHALVHKGIDAVLLVTRVRAQLACFVFPGREARDQARELKCSCC
jgi:hypothetical protein